MLAAMLVLVVMILLLCMGIMVVQYRFEKKLDSILSVWKEPVSKFSQDTPVEQAPNRSRSI